MYKQLNKVGTKAEIAIGNADVVELKQMKKTEERKEKISQGKKKQKGKKKKELKFKKWISNIVMMIVR